MFAAASWDSAAIEAARSVYQRHLVVEHKLLPDEASAIVDAWARSAARPES